MGLPDLAAKEVIELTAETAVGKALFGASELGIAEVLGSIGLKRAAAAVTKGLLGSEELEYLKIETDAIATGKVWVRSRRSRAIACRNYALTININQRSGADLLHMGFAHVFEDWNRVFFDGQSGIQWAEESFDRSGC